MTTGLCMSHPQPSSLSQAGARSRGRDVRALPPPARGSRGSYTAWLWTGLFLHLLITAEVKPDPGKQARSAEINFPQQDKSTDLRAAQAAAFPQAQQQLPGSSSSSGETCTKPAGQPPGRACAASGDMSTRITVQKPQLGVLTGSTLDINCPGSDSKETLLLLLTPHSAVQQATLPALHSQRGAAQAPPRIPYLTLFYAHICSANTL